MQPPVVETRTHRDLSLQRLTLTVLTRHSRIVAGGADTAAIEHTLFGLRNLRDQRLRVVQQQLPHLAAAVEFPY
jgi:hypothetical protein